MALSILALCFVLYMVGLFMVKSKINAIRSSYTASESKFVQEEKRVAIDQVVNSHLAEIEKVRKFFVAKGDEVEFIESIENLAKNKGLLFEIDTISQSPTGGEKKEDIVVKIDIEGGWGGAVSFIEELEKLPFGVSITKVELDTKSKGVWAGFVEFAVFREK